MFQLPAYSPSPGIHVSAEALATYRIERVARFLVGRSTLARRLVECTDAKFLELIVASLYDYQLSYIFDDARYRAWVKSRQIGGSHGLALAAVLQGLMEAKRDQIIISASQIQADELIAVANAHLDVFRKVTGVEMRSADSSANKQKITLSNGSRIFSRPANPRTIRSFHGDIHWDETAITAHDSEIFKAAWAIASRHNYRVSLISTPFGESGVFWDKARGPGAKAWSQHTTDIYQAVDAGCPVQVDEVRAGVSDLETWQQEYECAFLGDATSYFPFELLRVVASLGEGALGRMEGGEAPRAWYGGIDVGRHRDLTALSWLGAFDDGLGLLLPTETLAKAPFEQQHEWWAGAIRARRPSAMLIDSTGMGEAPAERLQRAFPGLVRGYNFGQGANKRAMVEHAKAAMEAGRVAMHPADRDTLAEFHTIKRIILPGGKVTYRAERRADGKPNPDGHADRATAAMLAELNRANLAEWFFDAPLDHHQPATKDEARAMLAAMEADERRLHEQELAAQQARGDTLQQELRRLKYGSADPWEVAHRTQQGRGDGADKDDPGPWRGAF